MNTKLQDLSDTELIQAYSSIIKLLKERGIIRSKNIIGDLGEYVVIDYYNKTPGLPNLQAAPPSTRNVDALSRAGDRYSIKASTGRVTGVFYGFPPKDSDEMPDRKFEFVIIVMFDEDYNLKRINELTWGQFLQYKRWHSRMKAWNISINNDLLKNTKTIYEVERNRVTPQKRNRKK